MLPQRIDAQAVAEKIGPYADARATLEERGAIYKELLGFVPPRIEARLAVTGALDPDLLDLQERLRAHAMYPRCFDVKTAQLMLFGMLLMDLSDAALLHALERGPEKWPTPERIELDRRLIGHLERGEVARLLEWLPAYSREAVAEMGGRVLAVMCGALAALHERAGALRGRLYGAYAQSSGSGNASVAVVPA